MVEVRSPAMVPPSASSTAAATPPASATASATAATPTTAPATVPASRGAKFPPALVTASDPPASSARLRDSLVIDGKYRSPVNQNGSFEFDRVIKSGYVQKRTQTTKTWRSIFLVLRPNTLSIYKSEKEDKLRHKIFLAELTAVTVLKDPKQKRQHVFGLFSPSRNFHFQAGSDDEARQWVELIRTEARIEEEEEEMFMASPVVPQRQSYGYRFGFGFGHSHSYGHGSPAIASSTPDPASSHTDQIVPSSQQQQQQQPNHHPYRSHATEHPSTDRERLASSSPEPSAPPGAVPIPVPMPASKRLSQPQGGLMMDSSGWSGNEFASSDYSDGDMHLSWQQRSIPGLSHESLAAQSPPPSSSASRLPHPSMAGAGCGGGADGLALGGCHQNVSQSSGIGQVEMADPDRVVWQGWLWFMRSKGGVRQWKDSWAVLRPRNLILYKDESEYAAQFIVPLPSVLNVVERDPFSRTKKHCLQIITEEKNYRFSAHDEETLLQCLGAFKSLLAKRRELKMRAAAAAVTAASVLPGDHAQEQQTPQTQETQQHQPSPPPPPPPLIEATPPTPRTTATMEV